MLTYELIERIVKKTTTKEDIIVLSDAFGSNRLGRDAFTSNGMDLPIYGINNNVLSF